MKFSIKNYWHPTPTAIRKLADFVFGLTIVISGIVAGADKDIIPSDQKVQLMFYITSSGAVLKYISNFFKENGQGTEESGN